MLETFETIALLRANHLCALAEEDAEILAARICGHRAGDIAEATFRSERICQRRRQRRSHGLKGDIHVQLGAE